MERSKPKAIVYQTLSYAPYMVPTFDALYDRIGEDFVVISPTPSPSIDPTRMAEQYHVASRMGRFPRRFVDVRRVPLQITPGAQGLPRRVVTVSTSLPRVLRSLDPACVISPNFNMWSLSSLVMGYPTILFWEGWSHTEEAAGVLRKLLRRWMASRASGWIAQGELSKQYLEHEFGVPAHQINAPGISPYPAPAALAERSQERRRTTRTVKFLSVARLTQRKGIDHLLRATALVANQTRPETRFEVVVLGEGPQRPELERLITELGLGSRVRLLGYTHPDSVWEHYADADVFILPTMQDHWALVVGEAASMGLPLLVSQFAGSAADIVKDGENGHRFDPTDHGQLSRLMLEYIRHPSLVPLHGERSLELIAPYTPESIADTIMSAVNEGPTRQPDNPPL